MNLLDYVEDYIEMSGNGKWCEDKVLISKTVVGVLDGATPIDVVKVDNNATQACWFVNEFAEGFSKYNFSSFQSIDYLCKYIITQIDRNRMLQVQDFNFPCCTAAFLLLKDEYLSISVIGDCHVYVLLSNKEISHIYDKRVDEFSGKTCVVSQKKYEDNLKKEEAIRKQKIANRKYLNKSDGFFALTLDDSWKGSFVEKQINISNIKSALICSDGFARLFIDYGIIDPKQFFEKKMTLLDGISVIRNYENSKTHTNKCVKNKDDVSAILLNFSLEE